MEEDIAAYRHPETGKWIVQLAETVSADTEEEVKEKAKAKIALYRAVVAVLEKQ